MEEERELEREHMQTEEAGTSSRRTLREIMLDIETNQHKLLRQQAKILKYMRCEAGGASEEDGADGEDE